LGERAREIAASLRKISDRSRESDLSIGEITRACVEQTEAVKQVNMAVGSIDQITQGNAASSEETAAAAQALSAQAKDLRATVAALEVIVEGGCSPVASSALVSDERPVGSLSGTSASRLPAGRIRDVQPS
jgi:methyl-accepting chemotaxis protein